VTGEAGPLGCVVSHPRRRRISQIDSIMSVYAPTSAGERLSL
jgi:hypothetical protein